MIDVSDLHKSFGDTAVLRGASFAVESGSIAALVGPNGSGKTTTLHVLAGLTTPDAGTARVDGHDVTTDRAAAQERLAFLPQDVRFHDALTPRQVLRFYAGLRDALPDRIDTLLSRVALTDAADNPCRTLSGGMRQRLGLALLDLADAPVLLLDEPALSLDPEWRTFLMEHLQARVAAGATVLLATHLLEVWRPLTDRVLRCADGTIRPSEAAPSESSPARPQVS
ncbi:MAG: heme ABC exporter ATP-binding protein CcmA [Salinivenus sp.]